MKRLVLLAAGLLVALPPVHATAQTRNGVDAVAALEMADMTWPEVRGAVERGMTVAIVPSGGIEQNGPHMVLGKHDYIVRNAAARIARELGNALVAPVISYVPEGDYAPPTGNLLYPGTLGVPEPVFAGILEGVARSLKNSGFKTIALIGDHGGNQAAQASVAAKLNREWAGRVKVLHVTDYYIDEAQMKFLRGKGETDATIGSHAGLIDTAELMSVRPEGVDLLKLRSYARKEVPGHSGDPERATPDLGRALLDLRVNAAIRQIKAAQ
jgi:creatinine amidohydrolase/Fe(II)-dependent formamide hydrolase-like protein